MALMPYLSLVPAESGWRAIFADSGGAGTGRSRVVAWAILDDEAGQRIVGIIADPSDPRRLVAADSVTDEDGGALQRYGFVE
jgi:hypothetical protein